MYEEKLELVEEDTSGHATSIVGCMPIRHVFGKLAFASIEYSDGAIQKQTD